VLVITWSYPDGSVLGITIDPASARVASVSTVPPVHSFTPDTPLTRLRRTLARILPALGE
jgi:hypothetical protein